MSKVIPLAPPEHFSPAPLGSGGHSRLEMHSIVDDLEHVLLHNLAAIVSALALILSILERFAAFGQLPGVLPEMSALRHLETSLA